MTAPVLLVTGASRGIGAAIAKLAGARGYDVAVNYLGSQAAAEDVVAAVKKAGRRAIAVQADMAKEADIARMFATVDKELGRITHFVYNTGITGDASRLEAADPAMMRRVIDTNVMGALVSTQAAIRRISKKQGGTGGAIVLISSAAATIGGPGEYTWYAASKGAIESLTIGLSKELAGDGIRINAIQPGVIDTDIHYAGRLERVLPAIPVGRAGTADEVAETALFLLSNASSYTTGTSVRVAGGR